MRWLSRVRSLPHAGTQACAVHDASALAPSDQTSFPTATTATPDTDHNSLRQARTWLMSCWWPVMRARGALLVDGSHRYMVKSSEPETRRSGRPLVAARHRFSASCTRASVCLRCCCFPHPS